MTDNQIIQIVSLIVTAIAGWLIKTFSDWWSKKHDNININKELCLKVMKEVSRVEREFPNATDLEKHTTVLSYIEKVCKQNGLSFDREFWDEEIPRKVALMNDFIDAHIFLIEQNPETGEQTVKKKATPKSTVVARKH